MRPPGHGHWRLVLDEAGARELEAARVASDERCRLALDEIRRVNHVNRIPPELQGHAYLDFSLEMDGLTARLRIYDPKYRTVGDEFGGSPEGR